MQKINKILSLILALLITIMSFSAVLFIANAEDFTPENLLLKEGMLVDKKVVGVSTNGSGSISNLTGNRVSAAGFNDIINGKTSGYTYVMEYWDSSKTVGFQFTLSESTFIGEVSVNGGYEDRVEKYDVFASDSEATLYSASSKVNSDLECLNGETSVTINKQAKYIAIVCTSCKDGGMRIKQIKVMSGKEPEAFKPENLLQKKDMLASFKAVGVPSNGSGEVSNLTGNRVSESGIKDIISGSTGSDTFVMDYWDNSKNVGLQFELSESTFIDKAIIDAGYADRKEIYDVYASDSEAILYSATSKIATGIECLNGETEVSVNKKAKYIAFVCTSCLDGGMRIKQIQVISGEGEKEFSPENLLMTAVSSGECYNMSMTNSSVSKGEKFNQNGALDIVTDGNCTTDKPVYDCIAGWEYPIYAGVLYTLDNVYSADYLNIFARGNVLVYAGTSLSTLYSNDNCVASFADVAKEGTKIDINKKVKYLAIFIVGYADVAEFELWSCEDVSDEEPEDALVSEGGKKVLTIGNSFSENASEYATEIAANQGYDLMFAYLKYPSSTINDHISNAKSNNACYKFEYTNSKGRVTVKDGSTDFATIKDALTFTDWDIVVLQQGSTASEDFSNYTAIGDLKEIVKAYQPNAEIMLHETWSWGIWDNEEHKRCSNIFANYYVTSKLLLDDATIIHSGSAIEDARIENKNHKMFNDTDGGNYQHLNAKGKYIAGAMYVATIFNCDFTKNTFGDGNSAFEGLNLASIRKTVNYYANGAKKDLDNKYASALEKYREILFGKNNNYIKEHFDSCSQIVQDIDNIESVYESDRFSEAAKHDTNTQNTTATMLAIDGDVMNSFSVWTAWDWETPKNIGVSYKLDGMYHIDTAIIYAGTPTNKVKFDVYAATVSGTAIYSEQYRVAKGVVCDGSKVEIKVGKDAVNIAFVMVGYTGTGNTVSVAEFDLTGASKPSAEISFSWPSVPKSQNLLKKVAPIKIVAPGGDYKSTKEYEYRFMDYKTETDLSKLVDDDLSKHYDIWSLAKNDKPGVLYDLGAFYDLSHLHAWAGVIDSELYTVNGYRIYASDSLSTLYKEKNIVFSYENPMDTTNEIGANVDLKHIRYIAFMFTNESGGWKLREIAAYGKLSADQSVPVEEKSIIEGLDAEFYGIATDNLYDPTYHGASDSVVALVDGKRENVEFWGGQDVANSNFVFIYNLYNNYDLTGVDVYSFADIMDEEAHVHKGIKTAKVYASRKLDGLFSTKPVVLKDGYDYENEPDEESLFSSPAPSEWKAARYIAFVFTIDDSHYGACRLEELKAYGKMSAVQDEEEEEAKLPQYIDIEADNGVIARIFALNSSDDLSLLDAHLNSTVSNKAEDLDFINSALSGYDAVSKYSIAIVNGNGSPVNTNGRFIRLSIPKDDGDYKIACVDDFGAEIVSNGILGNHLTVETSTIRSYALVKPNAILGANGKLNFSILWISIILLGTMALCGIGFSIAIVLKNRK